MDPRHRADEALARARTRGAFVVTPDSATSPMDASTTVRIPREVLAGSDERDPDSTLVIARSQTQEAQRGGAPAQAWAAQEGTSPGWPVQEWPTQEYQQNLPPNPHQTPRSPNQFGGLGPQPANPFPPPAY